jgi:hypothetical protein
MLRLTLVAAAFAMAALTPVAPASAQSASAKRKALEGTQTLPRRPAYQNLRKSDLYESRKFWDPAYGARTQGAPFDNGFFFETPTPPFGGTTPYMH